MALPLRTPDLEAWLGFGVALFLLPTALLGQGSGETALLEFRWPIGLHAEVVEQRETWENSSDGADSTSAALSYTMHVENHPQGYLLRHSDFVFSDSRSRARSRRSSDAEGEITLNLEELSSQVGAMIPSYVVSPRGELVGIDGLEALQSQAREMLLTDLAASERQRPATRDLLEQLLSRDFFLAQANEVWSELVGFWIGSELEIGVTYEFEQEEANPLVPNVLLPFTYRFGAKEMVPCTAGDRDADCIALELVSFPDPNAMEALILELLERMNGVDASDQVFYERLQMENYVLLVADPETLIPYRLESSKIVSGRSVRSDGEASDFDQISVRTVTYTYSSADSNDAQPEVAGGASPLLPRSMYRGVRQRLSKLHPSK